VLVTTLTEAPSLTPVEEPTEEAAEMPTEEVVMPSPVTPTPITPEGALGLPASSTPSMTPFALASPTAAAPIWTPTPVALPTEEAEPEEVPLLTLVFAGQEYTPVGYQYCQREPSGERLCREFPVTEAETKRISLLRGTAAQLQIAGERPTEVQIEYLSDTGVKTGQPEVQPGDNTILFTITPEPGTYIMAVRVTWDTEDATYFFRVTVGK
jgi:hypothetical protein